MDAATFRMQDARYSDRIRLTGIVLLYYDHFITLDSEIRLMWMGQKGLSSFIFLANRYFAFLTTTVYLTLILLSGGCRDFSELFREVTFIISLISVDIILILRVYALCGRNIWILLSLSGASLAKSSVAFWLLFKHRISIKASIFGCSAMWSAEAAPYIAAGWEIGAAMDIVMFFLTVKRSFKSIRYLREIATTAAPLQTIMLRDGVMYFAAIALTNLSNILTLYLSTGDFRGCLTNFVCSVSVIMANRLILNLHETAYGITTTAAELDLVFPSTRERVPEPRAKDRSTVLGA